MAIELSDRDRSVIAAIDSVRALHHACTAAAVADLLHVSRAYMSEVMHDMISRGLLTFTPEMPGSLRVIVEHDETPATAVACEMPGCGWPNQKALAMHQRRAHPTPKPAKAKAKK